MTSICRLATLPAALCAAGLVVPALACAGSVTSGVVSGVGPIQNAVVCLDANQNGRCDAGEASVVSGANGEFSLAGTGAVVAEIGTNALVAGKPVSHAMRLRAPAEAPFVVSGVSTEVQSLVDAGNGYDVALASLAKRLGVPMSAVLADPQQLKASDAGSAAILVRENGTLQDRLIDATTEAGKSGNVVRALRNRLALEPIQNVVIIYAENRSFDNVFGNYPGANGLNTPLAKAIKQVDRDGVTVLAKLPPAWGGMTAPGQTPVVTQVQTTNVWDNAPFQIDAPTKLYGYDVLTKDVITRDLYHRFFENAMQIDGGKNDQYAAWGDSGGLVMGHFQGSDTHLWQLAKQYTLADNFFQAAYGGSFLNHQYLVCACAPSLPAAVVAANKMSINVLTTPRNGVPQLAPGATEAASALTAPPVLKTGNVTPLDYFGAGDGYRAVNTMQAAYQPSGNKPVDNKGTDALYADPSASTTVPPQTQTTIGDLLSAKGVDWTWFSGGWSAASANPYPYNSTTNTFGTSTTIYNANTFGTADAAHTDFQPHHQPFNYYAALDPVQHPDARREHLKDRSDLIAQAQAGTLPAVSFYKPVGVDNEHPGYASLGEGDGEIAAVVAALQASPQWSHMLILVTYDEFGGQWDHVAPPKADLLGPGTRIPAVVISPFAKQGYVDHTPYDTGSYLRFVTHRFSLPLLPGLALRDSTLNDNGLRAMGDLTNALSF